MGHRGRDHESPAVLEAELELVHSLDVEKFKANQWANHEVFDLNYDASKQMTRTAEEERGVYYGYHVSQFGLDWLGSAPCSFESFDAPGKSVNNAAFFPTFQRLARAALIPGKSRFAMPNKQELQTWVDKVWNGEGVYYVTRPEKLKGGEDFEFAVTTTDNDTMFRGGSFLHERAIINFEPYSNPTY